MPLPLQRPRPRQTPRRRIPPKISRRGPPTKLFKSWPQTMTLLYEQHPVLYQPRPGLPRWGGVTPCVT